MTRTYHPQIKITLIKTTARQYVVPNASVNNRVSALTSLDLTPYLIDSVPISTMKIINEPAGAFAFSLIDKAFEDLDDSLYGLIEPMDMIEIRMARSAEEYANALPIVMRGFVSAIRRSRSMSGGRPTRTIQIAGHDYGKILQILRIYYLNNSVIGDNILEEMKFFHKYASSNEAKIMSADKFVALVVDKVINPYISRLTRDAAGRQKSAGIIQSIKTEVSIPGAIDPRKISVMIDCTVFQFLSSHLDIGPFNEIFLEDRDDGVYLVVRPNPYIDTNHNQILDGASVDAMMVDFDDIESIDESRSDAGVANYYWVSNSGWQLIENETSKSLADATPVDTYMFMTYLNTDAQRYGFRKMEVSSVMGPDTLVNSDATPASKTSTQTDERLRWLTQRREDLAALNIDNVLFEQGTIRMKGNERIKAGMMLIVTTANSKIYYYATGVRHEFIPFVGFKTIINYERGTGYINRIKQKLPYLAEISGKGAV